MASTLTRFVFALGIPMGLWAAAAPPVMFQGENPPDLIRIQTRLTDKTGTPLNNDFEVDVSLWTAATGGNLLFSERHTFFDVALGSYGVTDGFVDIVLGSGTVLGGFFPDFSALSGVWAEFTLTSLDSTGDGGLAGPEVLSPRLRLTSVPFALSAESVPDGAITTSKIADGAVTADKMAPGAAKPTGGWTGADIADDSLDGDDIDESALSFGPDQFSGSEIDESTLSFAGVTWSGTDLTGSEIDESQLSFVGVTWSGNDLTGSEIDEATLSFAADTFTGTVIDESTLVFGPDVFTGAVIDESSLSFTGLSWTGNQLSGSDLASPLDLTAHTITQTGDYTQTGVFTNLTAVGGNGVRIDSSDGAGDMLVFDAFGSQRIWLDGATGTIAGTVKAFVESDPDFPGQDIWYASIESRTPQLQVSGTANLMGGQSVVDLPRDFAVLARAGTLTVHLTPRSADTIGLAVMESTPSQITVRELGNGKGTFAFDYLVIAQRARQADWKTVRPGK